MNYYDTSLNEYLDKELETKPKNKKKSQPQKYFTKETEESIILYLNSNDQKFRNKIYKDKIENAFYKLAENIIHTFKFYYTDLNTVEELKHEVVTFLLEKLHKYKQERGKAYSYFGTIAKRYLIIYNQKGYNKLQNQSPIDEIDNENIIISQNLITSTNDLFDEVPFIDLFINYCYKNLYKLFPREKDNKTADIILELFNKRESLDILDKKALYIYIREMSDIPTTQITKIKTKLKAIYIKLYNEYYEFGHLISK